MYEMKVVLDNSKRNNEGLYISSLPHSGVLYNPKITLEIEINSDIHKNIKSPELCEFLNHILNFNEGKILSITSSSEDNIIIVFKYTTNHYYYPHNIIMDILKNIKDYMFVDLEIIPDSGYNEVNIDYLKKHFSAFQLSEFLYHVGNLRAKTLIFKYQCFNIKIMDIEEEEYIYVPKEFSIYIVCYLEDVHEVMKSIIMGDVKFKEIVNCNYYHKAHFEEIIVNKKLLLKYVTKILAIENNIIDIEIGFKRRISKIERSAIIADTIGCSKATVTYESVLSGDIEIISATADVSKKIVYNLITKHGCCYDYIEINNKGIRGLIKNH